MNVTSKILKEVYGITEINKKRLSRGNRKLSPAIGIFSLPSIITCKNSDLCIDLCYDKKVRYPAPIKFRWENFILSKHAQNLLENLITDQITQEKIDYVRIHEGGDYYDQSYISMWERIIKKNWYVKFYTYTKVFDEVKHWLDSFQNVNVINSLIKGKLNYGDEKYVNSLGVYVCPFHTGKVICGETCNYCMNSRGEQVAFIKH